MGSFGQLLRGRLRLSHDTSIDARFSRSDSLHVNQAGCTPATNDAEATTIKDDLFERFRGEAYGMSPQGT